MAPNNLRDRFQRNEIDIIPSAQILPPVLVMKRSVDADTNRAARVIGRREFMLAAVATSGLASSYLRGQLSSLRACTALGPGFDAASSNETVKGVVTPNVDFFIRNHFRTPLINEEKWNLEISGMVAKPLKLSYSDLLLTSSVRRPLTLECAGNFSGGAGVTTAGTRPARCGPRRDSNSARCAVTKPSMWAVCGIGTVTSDRARSSPPAASG